MSEGGQFWDIILFAMVAGFIILRLRSVLGRRPGDEEAPEQESMTRRGPALEPGQYAGEEERPSENVIRLEANPQLRDAYRTIMKADPGFDVDGFLDGAREAYPMLLEAFWSGDRETLKSFLAPDVFDQFNAAIDAREAAGHVVESRIVDIASAEISEAEVNDGVIEITMHYEAEIVSLTRDQDGNVVDGNMTDTVKVIDNWTFARKAKSRDPNWTLVATSDD